MRPTFNEVVLAAPLSFGPLGPREVGWSFPMVSTVVAWFGCPSPCGEGPHLLIDLEQGLLPIIDPCLLVLPQDEPSWVFDMHP
jgi:hypothetical protein